MIRDNPVLLFATLLGCGIMGAVGAAMMAFSLYGFFRWLEVKKAQIQRKRRRKSRLYYKDML